MKLTRTGVVEVKYNRFGVFLIMWESKLFSCGSMGGVVRWAYGGEWVGGWAGVNLKASDFTDYVSPGDLLY